MTAFPTHFSIPTRDMIKPRLDFIVLNSCSISSRLYRYQRSPIRNRGITNINWLRIRIYLQNKFF